MPSFPRRRAAALALSLLLGAPGPAAAADIAAVSGPGGPLLRLSGLVQPGDEAKLAMALAAPHRPAALSLASLGGNVQAALAIGAMVRREGLRTVVEPRAICASACGLIWLAGTARTMAPDAHVGLHAAYLKRNGVSVETGAANALVGAYLGRLGFDDRAIVYLTSAPPDDMTWILPADRQRYGIAYDTGTSPAAPPPATVAEGHFLSRPMALAGAIASAAVAAVDRLMGGRVVPAGEK